MRRIQGHGPALASLAVAGAVALAAAGVARGDAAAGKKGDDWENRFAGHEMWLHTVDEGLARAAKEEKPLLVDFFSHT